MKPYRRLMTVLNKPQPDKKSADKLLAKMNRVGTKNLYSLTYVGLARLEYSRRFGSESDQIDALENIVLFDIVEDKSERVLDDDAAVGMVVTLLELLLKNGRYSEFISYYEAFRKMNPKMNEIFSDAFASVNVLRSGKQAFAQNIMIDDRGFSEFDLFKRIFYFDTHIGKLKEVKLRCDTKFFKLSRNDQLEYQIPESWGDCNVQILGDPGTNVTLMQQ